MIYRRYQHVKLHHGERGGRSYVIGAGVEVDCSSTDVGGLGHPEEDHDECDTEGTAHGVERSLVAACLDDAASWSVGQLKTILRCRDMDSLIGAAKLIPPKTPRLKIADRYPRSWTNLLMSATLSTELLHYGKNLPDISNTRRNKRLQRTHTEALNDSRSHQRTKALCGSAPKTSNHQTDGCN